MPLVKQNAYKETYQYVDKILNEYKNCNNTYFDNEEKGIFSINPNYEITESLVAIDSIYTDALKLKKDLESTLKYTDIKTDKSRKRCKDCLDNINSVINNCRTDFNTIMYANKLSDATESDASIETLEDLTLYHEYKNK